MLCGGIGLYVVVTGIGYVVVQTNWPMLINWWPFFSLGVLLAPLFLWIASEERSSIPAKTAWVSGAIAFLIGMFLYGFAIYDTWKCYRLDEDAINSARECEEEGVECVYSGNYMSSLHRICPGVHVNFWGWVFMTFFYITTVMAESGICFYYGKRIDDDAVKNGGLRSNYNQLSFDVTKSVPRILLSMMDSKTKNTHESTLRDYILRFNEIDSQVERANYDSVA